MSPCCLIGCYVTDCVYFTSATTILPCGAIVLGLLRGSRPREATSDELKEPENMQEFSPHVNKYFFTESVKDAELLWREAKQGLALLISNSARSR